MLKKIRLTWQRQHLLFILLSLILILLLGSLALRYERVWVVATTERNQLSDSSLQLLQKIKEPLNVTAYVRGNPKVKNFIHERLSPYLQASTQLQLNFKNPDTDIENSQRYQINQDGELLLSYQGRHEVVRDLSEASVNHALRTLIQQNKVVVSFVTGHGERGNAVANHHYGKLFQSLQAQNINTNEQNLNLAQLVADNTDVLVIADPRSEFNHAEKTAITGYINKGGNVLILAERESISLQFITELFDVEITQTQILNDSGKRYGVDNNRVLVDEPTSPYPPLQGLDSVLLFPSVVQLQESKPSPSASSAIAGWQVLPVLHTKEPSILTQLDSAQQAPLLQNGEDKPYWYAIAVNRSVETQTGSRRQHIFLLGDADVFSNQFIGNGQNLQFALNLLNFLGSPDYQSTAIVRGASAVVFDRQQLSYLGLLQLLIIPLLILLFAGALYWRNRRRLL